MKKTSRGQEAFKRRRSKEIKVFVVEDSLYGIEGLQRTIEETPERDLEYVGSHSKNTPNLPDLIRDSKANVVLMDIVLGIGLSPEQIEQDKESSGIEAIKAIRRTLGKQIKILALSHWPQFRKKAFEAGVNGFVLQPINPGQIRQIIRQVYYRGFVPPDYFWISIGKIEGLELFPKSRQIIVIGNRGRTKKIDIESFSFAFLYYLAKERECGQENWVVKASDGYILQQSSLWAEICDQVGNTWGKHSYFKKDAEPSKPGSTLIVQWCAKINKKIELYLDERDQPLIQGPGGGRRKSSDSVSYSLNRNITRENLFIHD
jgi:DNA-binding NarL/FixJ family response regulator